MDNSQDHMDDLFRARFDGLKDHSIDPKAAWTAFEQQLNAPVLGSAGGSGFAWFSTLKVAASVAAIALIAGLASDQTQSVISDHQAYTLESSAESLPSVQASDQFKIENGDVAIAFGDAHEAHDPGHNSNGVFIGSSEVAEVGVKPTSSELESTENYIAFASTEASITTRFDEVDAMPRSSIAIETAGIENRNLDSDFELPSYMKPYRFYVRAAVRGGNGESNSKRVGSEFNLNPSVSGGIAYSISNNTFITAEIGYLRRTGNGIERSKDLDISNLYSVISCSYESTASDATPTKSPLKVQKSLIANQLDYLHFPVQMHVVLSPKSNVSIGFYAEYLLRAQNESYLVYSGEDYVSTPLGIGEANSKKGLNSTRVGIMAGMQRSITDKVSADIRGTLPISSIYDRSSEYEIQTEPNQLMDFQIGLIYKI